MPTLARQRASLFVTFAAAILLAGLLAWGLPGGRHEAAPDVTFELLDGRRQALADWRGHVVLVNFWATTCAPCIEELPELRALYQRWNGYGLEMVGVAMPYDPPSYVQSFQQRHALPYPIALDVAGTVTRAFRHVQAVPTSFLIGADGTMLYEHVGRLDSARIERILRRHLDGETDD